MQEYLDILKTPPMLHAIAGHMPIALAMLGFPLVLLAVLIRRWRALHWFALLTYAIAAASAYGAMLTGEEAMEAAPNTLSAEIWQGIEAHEELGEIAWIGALVTFVLLAVMFINQSRLRMITGILAIIASLATAGIIAVTAHRGGMLVYEHGVGTRLVNGPAAVPSEPLSSAPESASYAPELQGNTEMPQSVEKVPVELPEDSEADTQEATPDSESYEPELWGNSEMPEVLQELPPVPNDKSPNTPAAAATPSPAQPALVYSKDIEPILEEHCFDCHGEELPDGELDMTKFDNLLKGGEKGGPAVVPGDPDASAIIKYLEGVFQPQMPYKKDPLAPATIDVLREWIAQGAPHPDA